MYEDLFPSRFRDGVQSESIEDDCAEGNDSSPRSCANHTLSLVQILHSESEFETPKTECTENDVHSLERVYKTNAATEKIYSSEAESSCSSQGSNGLRPHEEIRWRGALIPSRAKIEFLNTEPKKRQVSAFADSKEVENIISVKILCEYNVSYKLLFDLGHGLQERILREQFF